MDYPADGDGSIGLFYSNRSITTEATCTSHYQEATVYENNTVKLTNFDYLFPADSTYYFVANGTEESCGPRCAKVWAIENFGTDGYWYQCNVTVGTVVNASSIRWA